MPYLAAIAVDRRQNFILGADKLREMTGASKLIADTVRHAQDLAAATAVSVIRPVSGEIWVKCDDLHQLRGYLWDLRRQLVEKDTLGVTFAVVKLGESPRESYQRLESELRMRKGNRPFEDGHPASPFFARCRIQPDQPANCWWEGDGEGDREPRRLLASTSSRKRLDARTDLWDAPINAPKLNACKKPREFRHLTGGEGDSYIALLKGDIDGLGTWQMEHNWDAPEPSVGEFSLAVEDVVKKSVFRAMERVLDDQTPSEAREFAPFLPLVMAGDDIWVLCRRRLALKLANLIGEELSQRSKDDEAIQKVTNGKALSISFGILFAKQGFPFDQQLVLADELLANAKRHRNRTQSSEAWIDYFWLESSGRQSIDEARQEGGGYYIPEDGQKLYRRLYTRPWTLAQCEAMRNAAAALAKAVPGGKLKLLETSLRMGNELTALALHRWWVHLGSTEKKGVTKALADMPEGFKVDTADLQSVKGALPIGPWGDSAKRQIPETALAELVELSEIEGEASA
jgi:hypothetical protein